MKNPIIVPNGDSTIWDRDRVIADLVMAMINGSPFEISMNNEGPCAESLGFYSLLDLLCTRYQFPSNKITICTNNQIETHNSYNIKKHPPIKGVVELQKKYSGHIFNKIITSDTKYFSNFVSRGNRMRLVIASELYFNHGDKTIQSYHTDTKNGYFSHHIGLEDVMFHDYDPVTVDRCYLFLKKTPITIDAVESYPILHGDKVYDILMQYQKIFVDIVNLPYFSGNTFYLDEKIWRPILTRTPFIVQGPRNFLQNFRRLGFKTFDRWWDEGFSEDPPDYQVIEIIKIIDKIAQWDLNRINNTYDQMKSVLDHNYKRFMELTAQEFKKIFSHD
jgi:hypothetical protein